MAMNVESIRKDFPILNQRVNGEQLVYLDNAATSQTPLAVIKAIQNYYLHDNANVHRGVHTLAERATQQYETARQQVAHFIHAAKPDEVVFTRSTTEAINLIARGFTEPRLHAGDEIVVSIMEHHSNLVPWQELAQRTGAKLRFIGLNQQQELDLNQAGQLIGPRTKLVALTAVSNVLGTTNPVSEVAKLAHQQGAVMVVDAAQLAGHAPIDVQKLDADFIAFSGHKMLGPTGIGVAWGKEEYWQQARPVQFGGEMINNVTPTKSDFKPAPLGFEAGTPNIEGAIALSSAIDYLQQIGLDQIRDYEQDLADYLRPRLLAIPGLTLYGPQDHHGPIFAFNLAGIHPHDAATALDMEGVAVRAGHHCAQPLMAALGVHATIRASLSFYNTRSECDRLIAALQAVRRFFDNGTR